MNTHSALDRENANHPPAMPEIPAQMRAVLNGIPAMVAYWDAELRNRLANDAYLSWFGVDAEQLYGMHIQELLHKDVYEANRGYIAKVLDGEAQLFKRTLTDSAGGTRHTEVSYMPDERDGAVQGFFVMVTDVTERVLAEHRQHRDTDRYRALAGSIPGVFVLLFDADLRYLIAEGQELHAFGYRSEELEGHRIHDVLEGWLAEELEPRYRAALAGEEVSWTRRIGARTYRLKAGPVTSDGATAGMVVAVDITERLQQEQTWAALHEIATAVARNAAPEDISVQLAFILRDLFAVDSAAVVRFTGPLSAEIVAMAPALPPTLSREHNFALTDNSATVRVAVTGKPALVVYGSKSGGVAEGQMLAGGFRSAAAAPIRVHGSLWGVVTLTSKSSTGVTAAMLERLAQFAELVEIAIGNTEARVQLERQATTDELSGLPNRRSLEQHLAREIERAAARGTRLSAVVLDIDHFKKVNDTFGHLMGDVVLADVAARLRAVARKDEIVARFGGEEFVWLLPGTDGAEALLAAERARVAIGSEPFGDLGHITVSAGVCELSDAGSRGLLACADRALYAAKHAGRDRSERYGAAG